MSDSPVCANEVAITKLDFGDWLVTIYEAPAPGAERSFDASVALETGDGIAVAVADSAVNIAAPNRLVTSEFALTAFAEEVADAGIARGFDNTAARIHDPKASPRRRNAALTAAGVQIGNDRRIEAFRCGDSEVWARYGGEWLEVMPGDMLTPEGRAAFSAVQNPCDRLASWRAEEVILDDLTLWSSPPIGMDFTAHARRRFISGAEEIAVSTDGARLNQDRLGDLAGWMTDGVHTMPVDQPHPQPHGDLTVIHVVRTAMPANPS